MSKRAVRISFAVLLSLAVIAVIFTSVQAAFLNAGGSSGRVFVDAGLQPDLAHVRAPAVVQQVEIQSNYYVQPSNLQNMDGHGCESELKNDPND